MKLVKIYGGKVISEVEVTTIEGLSNDTIIKGFKQEGFKNQKSLKVRACSSVKFINEFLSTSKIVKAINYSNKMSFEEYVSDFFDLHIALLSDEVKAEYFKSYKGV